MKQKSRVMQQALREGDPMAIHSLDASSPFSERTEEETKAMWVPEGSTLRTSRGIHFYGDRDRNRNDITFAPLAQLQGRISTKVTTPIPPKAREENNLRSMRDIKVTEDLRWWPPCIDRSWPTAISVGQPKFPRSSSTATNADRVAACVGRNCGEGLGSALPLAATRLRNHVESFLEGVGGSRAEGRHLVQVLQLELRDVVRRSIQAEAEVDCLRDHLRTMRDIQVQKEDTDRRSLAGMALAHADASGQLRSRLMSAVQALKAAKAENSNLRLHVKSKEQIIAERDKVIADLQTTTSVTHEGEVQLKPIEKCGHNDDSIAEDAHAEGRRRRKGLTQQKYGSSTHGPATMTQHRHVQVQTENGNMPVEQYRKYLHQVPHQPRQQERQQQQPRAPHALVTTGPTAQPRSRPKQKFGGEDGLVSIVSSSSPNGTSSATPSAVLHERQSHSKPQSISPPHGSRRENETMLNSSTRVRDDQEIISHSGRPRCDSGDAVFFTLARKTPLASSPSSPSPFCRRQRQRRQDTSVAEESRVSLLASDVVGTVLATVHNEGDPSCGGEVLVSKPSYLGPADSSSSSRHVATVTISRVFPDPAETSYPDGGEKSAGQTSAESLPQRLGASVGRTAAVATAWDETACSDQHGRSRHHISCGHCNVGSCVSGSSFPYDIERVDYAGGGNDEGHTNSCSFQSGRSHEPGYESVDNRSGKNHRFESRSSDKLSRSECFATSMDVAAAAAAAAADFTWGQQKQRHRRSSSSSGISWVRGEEHVHEETDEIDLERSQQETLGRRIAPNAGQGVAQRLHCDPVQLSIQCWPRCVRDDAPSDDEFLSVDSQRLPRSGSSVSPTSGPAPVLNREVSEFIFVEGSVSGRRGVNAGQLSSPATASTSEFLDSAYNTRSASVSNSALRSGMGACSRSWTGSGSGSRYDSRSCSSSGHLPLQRCGSAARSNYGPGSRSSAGYESQNCFGPGFGETCKSENNGFRSRSAARSRSASWSTIYSRSRDSVSEHCRVSTSALGQRATSGRGNSDLVVNLSKAEPISQAFLDAEQTGNPSKREFMSGATRGITLRPQPSARVRPSVTSTRDRLLTESESNTVLRRENVPKLAAGGSRLPRPSLSHHEVVETRDMSYKPEPTHAAGLDSVDKGGSSWVPVSRSPSRWSGGSSSSRCGRGGSGADARLFPCHMPMERTTEGVTMSKTAEAPQGSHRHYSVPSNNEDYTGRNPSRSAQSEASRSTSRSDDLRSRSGCLAAAEPRIYGSRNNVTSNSSSGSRSGVQSDGSRSPCSRSRSVDSCGHGKPVDGHNPEPYRANLERAHENHESDSRSSPRSDSGSSFSRRSARPAAISESTSRQGTSSSRCSRPRPKLSDSTSTRGRSRSPGRSIPVGSQWQRASSARR